MYYDITKVIFAQLFPKGVLPTAIAVIVAALSGLVWLIIKKEDSFLMIKVSDFLKNKSKWFVNVSKLLFIIVLLCYWLLDKICPEIKLGFLGNAFVLILLCAADIVAMCISVVSNKIIESGKFE